MEQVAENVYRLGTRYHNFYTLVEGGKAIVIDAGCSKELSVLSGGLATIGMGLGDVEAIVLTHAHADHMGFAAEAAGSGTEVRTHELDGPIALGDQEMIGVSPWRLPLWRISTLKFLLTLVKVGVGTVPRLDAVETFADGEVLDLPGRPRAIHTPGHTVGHCALLSGKLLFSGDALVTMNLVGRDRGPQMLPKPFHTDEDKAWESLELLKGLDTSTVFPGHGAPWPGQIADAIEAIKPR